MVLRWTGLPKLLHEIPLFHEHPLFHERPLTLNSRPGAEPWSQLLSNCVGTPALVS